MASLNKFLEEEDDKITIDDYIEEPWFKEIFDVEFKDDKEKIIESLKSYLKIKKRSYKQGMNYIFFCLEEIYE